MSTAGPAHRVVSAVVEYGFPQGHIGHLSPDEEAAFTNFKLLCADKGCYSPGNGEDEAPSHDDPTMLRFLRARRFVVQDAFKQFADTEIWRKANQLDQLYETIDLGQYEESRRLYPQWTGRRDRRGLPLYVFEVKHLNAKTMAAYERSAMKTDTKAKLDGKTSPKLLRLFALYENLTRFVMPLCTALTDRDHPRTPITQGSNIVDISGVGLKQFWNLRGHMQDASTLATAHYPETLDRIFIIGAPVFFPTVWSWIKKWFDPITTSKIFILSSHEVKKTLETFIDPQNYPKKYGGELDYHFGDLPILDPALKDLVSWEGSYTDFPHGPMYWVSKKDEPTMKAVAVGSVDQTLRKSDVCTLKKLAADLGTADSAAVPTVDGTELLTRAEDLPELTTASTAAPSEADSQHPPDEEKAVLQDGAAAPPPAPVSAVVPVAVVDIREDLHALSLNEKAGNLPNVSIQPPQTAEIASKLDSAVTSG